MTEILNSGVEFDGVLISQCAEAALAAFDSPASPIPSSWASTTPAVDAAHDRAEQGREEDGLPGAVNPPGVGASALNFGLNILLQSKAPGRRVQRSAIHSILLGQGSLQL